MAEVCAESPRDSGAVYAVNRAALGGPDEAALVDALREAGAPFVSMVAADETAWWSGTSSAASIEPEPPDEFRAVGPAPMAVLPARQRRGADTGLVESGIEERRRCGYDAIFVLGALNGYAVW